MRPLAPEDLPSDCFACTKSKGGMSRGETLGVGGAFYCFAVMSLFQLGLMDEGGQGPRPLNK